MGCPEEDFVRAVHRADPGVTARTLAAGRVVGDGRSSYDLLADAIEPGGPVLDLGCGDGLLLEGLAARGHATGALLGLDVSPDELALARRRLPTVALLHARAQALPIVDGAVAAVVSHLAWTLLPSLDRVAAELARVLAPGGRFVTIVGGGPAGDDAFAGLLELAAPLARAAPPTPRLGELRGRTDAGLAALLGGAGFRDLAIRDLALDLSGDAAAVFAALAPGYHLATLDEAARAALAAAFTAAAPRWRRADGAIAATMYLRLVSATRARR